MPSLVEKENPHMKHSLSINEQSKQFKTIEEAEKLHNAMVQLKDWINGKWAIDKIHNIESDDLHGKFWQVVKENEITCI
jgi:hypothetical protein